MLIADRFEVREAIRHSYRGGVFRGTDRHTGADVILKQARPHVASQLTGEDARDTLRHEAEILGLLGPPGLTPRVVAVVTHQENLFLVEDLVPGVTLRAWAADRYVEWGDRGAPLAEALDKAGRLIELMAAIHEHGLVLRDFTPNNIMVTPDGRPRLIDVEFAARTGSRVHRSYTPGYVSPEHASAPRYGPAPALESDLYSLGATICYLVSATHPLLPDDEPPNRPGQERVATLVGHLGASMPALRHLAPLVLITPGHVNYVDSPWAVTTISQAQFWRRDFATYGDGTVRDCLSSILSDWFTPGSFNAKPAKDCTPTEIAFETWRQIKAHLNDTDDAVLTDDMLHSWFLDPAIIASGTPAVTNDEPLFIQSPNSWKDRPHSHTAIPNLFLAGDWVRTDINVTTMEGANEGGRTAVNALLDAANSPEPRCPIKTLFQPPEFEPFKAIDRHRYRWGLPNTFDILDPRAP